MTEPWYPDLIKVFYANLNVVDGIITFRVKGVDVKLDGEIWSSIVMFCPGGVKSHHGFLGLNKISLYQACLRYLDEARDYTLFRAGGMKRVDIMCLCSCLVRFDALD
ncbi:hypothetical protein V8G54_003825 [Vigna mungo]|uniref:Uncharacterized protein n=1 Tax=Vigna mungo TaxID=3915 RepID=A0AAQ3PCF6_VIGMU